MIFELRKHTEQKHKKNVRIVGKIFDIDEDLMNHMRNEHYEHNKEFNCEKGEKCDFQTNSASYLRKHIEIKHEIRCNQMHQCIMHQIPWSLLRFMWEVRKVISVTNNYSFHC